MKLQHLMIIFAIIFLPIILITSYYIQKQVDTIDLQLSYDSKLLDATYDAMSAFEINTANEDLSTVSDSLRSIIEASNGIFLNTLATNLGYSNASKYYVQPYIPAVLYTLYDGYYIYAPTNEPTILADKYGQTVTTADLGVSYKNMITVNGKSIGIYEFDQDSITYLSGSTEADSSPNEVDYDNLPNEIKEEYGQLLYKNKDGTYSTVLHSTGADTDTYYKQDYILKSYVSYAANYQKGNINVTINYTLDNFISISGTIDGVNYSKSGYLISNDLISGITITDMNGNTTNVGVDDWSKYSDETWEEYIYDPENYKVTISFNDGTTTISNDETYDTAIDDSIVSYWDDAQSAVEYYIDSWMFSKWVYENLGTLTGSDVKTSWTEYNDVSIDTTSTELAATLIEDVARDGVIFNSSEDPEGESTFEEHRRKIIKNSINYNLALALITYSNMRTLEEYDLPIFSDEEWDTILNNVSVVSFMQGLDCGLKIYNNYAIATSTNNEITVTTNEIYYVAVQESSIYEYAGQPYGDGRAYFSNIEDSYYDQSIETAHRIDCPYLLSTDYYISFTSKEIKYDKIYDKTLRQICI